MKNNDGKRLEELTRIIEGQLSPKGFKVESRKPVFNDDGVQVAEFDIVISGRLGTAELSWLIECRDRPSDGAAGAEWIEQLIGRRTRFLFDKVMAVSSTGFSPGATDLANDYGIELRHLHSLTYDDVSTWLPVNAPLLIRKGIFSDVRVYLLTPNHLEEGAQRSFTKDDKVLVERTSDEAISIVDFWRKVINNNEVIWEGVSVGGPPKNLTVNVKEYLIGEYVMRFDEELLRITSIEFDATLQIIVPNMPLVEAAAYATASEDPSGKKTFAKIGRWKSEEDGPIKEITFIGFPKREQQDSDN